MFQTHPRCASLLRGPARTAVFFIFSQFSEYERRYPGIRANGRPLGGNCVVISEGRVSKVLKLCLHASDCWISCFPPLRQRQERRKDGATTVRDGSRPRKKAGPSAPLKSASLGMTQRNISSCCPTLNADGAFRMGHPFSWEVEDAIRRSWYPRSPIARDQGHPFFVVDQGREMQKQVPRLR